MQRTRLSRFVIASALAGALLVVAGFCSQQKLREHEHALREALDLSVQTRETARRDVAQAWALTESADSMVRVARQALAEAGAREAMLRQSLAAARKMAAPDTCAPFIAAANARTDSALVLLDDAQAGMDSLFAANDSLTSANGLLQGTVASLLADGERVDSAGRRVLAASRWSRLLPEIGLGATIGVDPVTMAPARAVGLTFSWSF